MPGNSSKRDIANSNSISDVPNRKKAKKQTDYTKQHGVAVWNEYLSISKAKCFPSVADFQKIIAMVMPFKGEEAYRPKAYQVFIEIWVREACYPTRFSTSIKENNLTRLRDLCFELSKSARNLEENDLAWNYFCKLVQLSLCGELKRLSSVQLCFGLDLALSYFDPNNIETWDELAVFCFELKQAAQNNTDHQAAEFSQRKYDDMLQKLEMNRFESKDVSEHLWSFSPFTKMPSKVCYFDSSVTQGLDCLPAAGAVSQKHRHDVIKRCLDSSKLVKTNFSHSLAKLPPRWKNLLALVKYSSNAQLVLDYYARMSEDLLKKLLQQGCYDVEQMIKAAVWINNGKHTFVSLSGGDIVYTQYTLSHVICECFSAAEFLYGLEQQQGAVGEWTHAEIFHPGIYPLSQDDNQPKSQYLSATELQYHPCNVTQLTSSSSPTFIQTVNKRARGDSAMGKLQRELEKKKAVNAIVLQLGLDSDLEDLTFDAESDTRVSRESLNEFLAKVVEKLLEMKDEGMPVCFIMTLEGGYNLDVIKDFFSVKGSLHDNLTALSEGGIPFYVHCGNPTHHAGEHGPSGFCYGNLAYAMIDSLRQQGLSVFSADTDFNHGDGTLSLFSRDFAQENNVSLKL